MPALKEIADHFGNSIILPDGMLNRAALRKKIFADDNAKSWLESLLHPRIREWIKVELASAISPYAILESPLLLEMGQHQEVDRVLVVDVPEELQIARASLRDQNSPEQIRAIIQAQISRPQRLALADDVIDNSCTLAELADRVSELHQLYLEHACIASGASSHKT